MSSRLGFTAAQILAERGCKPLLSILVFGVHLRHMAPAPGSRKRVDGRRGRRHRRALPNKLLP